MTVPKFNLFNCVGLKYDAVLNERFPMQYSPKGLFNENTLLSVRYELNLYVMLIHFIFKGVEGAAGTTCCEGRAGRRSMGIIVHKM